MSKDQFEHRHPLEPARHSAGSDPKRSLALSTPLPRSGHSEADGRISPIARRWKSNGLRRIKVGFQSLDNLLSSNEGAMSG